MDAIRDYLNAMFARLPQTDEVLRAKEELGIFYRHKIAKRQKEEYDKQVQ